MAGFLSKFIRGASTAGASLYADKAAQELRAGITAKRDAVLEANRAKREVGQREFTVQQTAQSQEFRSSEATAQREFQAGESATRREFQAGESATQREFQAGESAKGRSATLASPQAGPIFFG